MPVVGTRYNRRMRFTHWLLAVLIIGMLTIGLLLSTIHQPLVTMAHKLVGLFVLLLVLFTLGQIVFLPKAIRPASMPRWQQKVARSVQHTMLLCALIMPLSGWFMASAAGKPPAIAGILLAMPWVPLNHAAAHIAGQIHYYVGYVLIALVSIHTLAALWHHFCNKDDVLRHMLKG